ncbi:MAG: hypothetical protein KDB27_22140 [Planctomycetales bacterium]|nr:hypothetical protein [Planctomycetales bacterium]
MRVFRLGACVALVSLFSSWVFAADIVPIGSNWSYLNPQTTADSPSKGNFDSTWFTAGYDDSSWGGPSAGPFVRGTADSPGISAFTSTSRNYIRDAGTFLDLPESGERNTAYFRHEFTTAAAATDLAIDLLADDGARVYLDGKEILSVNCCINDNGTVNPGSPTTYTDLAVRAGSESEYARFPVLVGQGLTAGSHVLAVAVHQSSDRSNDMGFSLNLSDGYIYRPFVTEFSDGWRYFSGEEEPSDGTLDWTTVEFDAGRGWFDGQDGFGYEAGDGGVTPYVNTQLEGMQDIYSTVYLRKQFSVASVDEIGELSLTVDYDDSFIAYINGTEVVRAGIDGEVGSVAPFDVLGTSHESTNADGSPAPVFTISLADYPDLLNIGDNNVLAIQGANTTLDSSDFLVGRISLAGLAAQMTAPNGDFDGNGVLDAADIDALTAAVQAGNNPSEFDVNGDGAVDQADRTMWVEVIKNTYFGDSDLDGEFGTRDFVTVFTAGQYEDTTPGNSSWATGDWNGDGDFGTPDFVAAFSAGGYEKGARPGGPNAAAVPEPGSIVLLICGLITLSCFRRK